MAGSILQVDILNDITMKINKHVNLTATTVFTLLFLGIILAEVAFATSASISVGGNEGAIPVNAQATFTTYEDGDNSGALSVYHKQRLVRSVPGNGSASWSTTYDGGKMAQGSHAFKAMACDSERVCSSSSQTITIDNTPVLQSTLNGTEGEIDFSGSVDFKEHVGGHEGALHWYHNGRYQGGENIENTGTHTWSWKKRFNSIIDSGKLSQGEHTFTIYATANNGTRVSEENTIAIDNTPVLQSTLNGTAGEIDFSGFVGFKEDVGGY